MLLDLFFSITGLLLLFVFFYLFILAFAALVPEKETRDFPPEIKFLIVIPAHNEAESIGQTLKNLEKVNYPKKLWEVIVIADYCTDNTVEVVKNLDVPYLEHMKKDRKGKGHVLSWAFRRLLSLGEHDAFIVIDADTHIKEDFLTVMNRRLLSGEKVIQAYSQVRHPESSPLESLAFLGFALNRNLRYKGRSRLGWQANLMGTGMCFSRDVIERFGWPALSMVEDLEFTMFLKLHGIRVTFAQDAKATVELHRNLRDSRGQRLRWDMGKFQIRDKYLPLLLKQFWITRDLSYLDTVMELLLPPYSIFFFTVCALFVLFLILDFKGLDMLFWLWVGVMACLLVYTVMGLVTAKANLQVYRNLIYAPFFIIWRWWILLMEHFKIHRKDSW